MTRWPSRVRLEKIESRSDEWVFEGYRLFLRSLEEHDEAQAWCLHQRISFTPKQRLCFGSYSAYDTESYLIIYREEDAFLIKLRWL